MTSVKLFLWPIVFTAS